MQTSLRRSLTESIGFGLLAGLLFCAPVEAHEGYDEALRSLCVSENRPSPSAPNSCAACHIDTSGGGARNAAGKLYETGNRSSILSFFCPSEQELRHNVHYNGKTDGALPPAWLPAAETLPRYEGSLPTYWSVTLESDASAHQVSSVIATSLAAAPLVAGPDNCWGHAMNFGLLHLDKDATLTVTLSPEGASDIIPGFALYQGWDSGQSASRDETILFGASYGSPLGTTGLYYVADRMGEASGSTLTASFNLRSGNYTVFVTVGSNQSRSGSYRLDLRTSAFGNGDALIQGDAQCGVANDSEFSNPKSPTPDELCASGTAGSLAKASAGRLTWSCMATAKLGLNVQCFSASKNGKINQPPLYLRPGSLEIKAGNIVNEFAEGGRAQGGSTRFGLTKPLDRGVKCKLKPKGYKASVTATGSGRCEVFASKAGDRHFNDTRSGPVLIFVDP